MFQRLTWKYDLPFNTKILKGNQDLPLICCVVLANSQSMVTGAYKTMHILITIQTIDSDKITAGIFYNWDRFP